MNRVLAIVPCHRMKNRCITIKGYTLPLCARCTGILIGYFFFPILLLIDIHISIWLGLFINIPMIIDGWTQKKKYRMSNNTLRLFTGIICGFGQSILIVSISDFIVSLFQ
ncbi:DUF2085 domain-containing protein [Cytobacillus praedii]|uniref:DUF2085 domain-containing protein n=1 Tax=Cytobacillus praedii TaxID=1742358 RepID=UPI002E2245B5|nr:DUF2085 domain-containing protein [Cytobacillus praedii]